MPGVIPCAVQNVDTGEVILVAYVNDVALHARSRRASAVFWSTSRNELWEKGKTSGETFDLLEVRVNCEQNSLLYVVRPRRGGICHTKNAAGEPARLLLPPPQLRDLAAGEPLVGVFGGPADRDRAAPHERYRASAVPTPPGLYVILKRPILFRRRFRVSASTVCCDAIPPLPSNRPAPGSSGAIGSSAAGCSRRSR